MNLSDKVIINLRRAKRYVGLPPDMYGKPIDVRKKNGRLTILA